MKKNGTTVRQRRERSDLMLDSLGKMVLIFGVVLVLIGGLMVLGGRLFGLGRLPGDIFIQKGNFSFYFPVVTCIALSVLLTIILNLIRR